MIKGARVLLEIKWQDTARAHRAMGNATEAAPCGRWVGECCTCNQKGSGMQSQNLQMNATLSPKDQDTLRPVDHTRPDQPTANPTRLRPANPAASHANDATPSLPTAATVSNSQITHQSRSMEGTARAMKTWRGQPTLVLTLPKVRAGHETSPNTRCPRRAKLSHT